MADYNCSSCEDLRETSPSFVVNGITDTECSSLKNNTGLNPSSGHNDCTDLNNINDCLVGNMAEEIEAYDVCDWKDYMKKFVPNVWTTLKAIICAVCGIWTNIDKIWCWLDHLTKNTGGTLHAYVDDDPSKAPLNGFRIAGGVQARMGADAAPMVITVIGSTARITGSLDFSGKMPSSYAGNSTTDWLDFYDGGTDVTNAAGHSSRNGNTPMGGFFIYEYEVNPCDYGFKALYTANLMGADAGNFVFRVYTWDDGDHYPYDYGWGQGGAQDGPVFHASKEGNILIQVRMEYVGTWGIASSGGKITPNGITMAAPCRTSWEC